MTIARLLSTGGFSVTSSLIPMQSLKAFEQAGKLAATKNKKDGNTSYWCIEGTC
jgi:hypothetical protein